MSCCAVNCTNRWTKGTNLKFYRFPCEGISKARREKWIAAVKRVGWLPNKHTRICSEHFISKKPSRVPQDPDYAPSVFNYKRKVADMSTVTRYERAIKKRSYALNTEADQRQGDSDSQVLGHDDDPNANHEADSVNLADGPNVNQHADSLYLASNTQAISSDQQTQTALLVESKSTGCQTQLDATLLYMHSTPRLDIEITPPNAMDQECSTRNNPKKRKDTHNCCVPQCSEVKNASNHMHSIPKDTVRRKQWALAIKTGKDLSRYMHVCSKHFCKEDYFPTGAKKAYLKKTAVPSQNLPVRSYKRVETSPLKSRKTARTERVKKRAALKCHDQKEDPGSDSSREFLRRIHRTTKSQKASTIFALYSQ